MKKLNDIFLDNRVYEIYYQVGTVLKEAKRSEIHVSGGGGSINTIGGNTFGQINEVSSFNTVFDDLIISDNNGKEFSFQFSDFDLVIRGGNEIGIVWAVLKGQVKRNYLLVINNSTDSKFLNKNAISKLFGLRIYELLICSIIGFVCLAIHVFVGFLIIFLGWVLVLIKAQKRKKLVTQFTVELNRISFKDFK
mgnify:CR=1 FL=1